jgi:flagellar biosynthesis/type III secretory pathway M-ring protein FliF/YscJ
MERIRQLLSYINARMSVLNVSQRIAIGLCAALIAGSVLWLLQWSTTPELVPLVNHDFTFTELDAAEAALKSNGIRHEAYGTRLFVRAADRHNALRLIHAAGALPEGSLFDMEAVVTSQNPFQAPEAREFAQNYAIGNELAKIIATSPSVRQASVIVNPKTTRRLGGRAEVPTASVTVTLAPGKEMTAEVVEGFAKLVSGAISGLKPHNVSVTDAKTLRSFNVPHPDDAVSFDYLRLVKQHEAHLRSKIQTKLADIPGVQVAVSVELDTSKRITQNIKHDQPQPKTETSQSSETSDAAAPAEGGVQANLGQALTAAGPGSGTTTEETSVENFEPKVSRTETVEQMPFAIKSVAAAVGIPRSFVAAVCAARFPDKSECKDDDPDFVSIRDEQVSRVKASVERIAMARDPADVQVDVYPDMDWTASEPAWNGAADTAGALAGAQGLDPLGFVQTYAAQLGLVFLALTSLFMMMRIIRKSPPIPGQGRGRAAEGVDEPAVEPLLTVGRRSIGQAEVSDTFLTGHEVDDDTLRYQELGREVSQLVADDPESAAHLLRRWIGETT